MQKACVYLAYCRYAEFAFVERKESIVHDEKG